jgi:pimeloyl-ACP methyl ester carboxylesterase
VRATGSDLLFLIVVVTVSVGDARGALMQADEGFVTTDDGVNLFYRRAGRGDAALVIPNGVVYGDDFRSLARTRTLLVYDVRNRGRSDAVTDPARLARGIHHDVDDLEAVRRHFGWSRIDLLGHSYQAVTVALYARARPERVGRVVQVGAPPPVAGRRYPPALMHEDDVASGVMRRLAAITPAPVEDPVAGCRAFWAVLRELYVADPRLADRADWGRCDLATERHALTYLRGVVFPSLDALQLSADALRGIRAPVLVVHGRQDRSAPYGGGREWAAWLPDARLLTVADAGHAPWIEAPEVVLTAIETFLAGRWPGAAMRVPLQPAGAL